MGSIDKQRIIQEMVPGKQVTLAHIIPSPDQEIYQSLGLNGSGALGILTITPSEAAIIAADIARKSSNVHIGFWIGSLVLLFFVGMYLVLKLLFNLLRII